MKCYVEIEPICPFVGKPCIKDGWQSWNQKVLRPCAFWDDFPHGQSDLEPCKIKRAINKLLSDEVPDENCPVEVPWDTTKKE